MIVNTSIFQSILNVIHLKSCIYHLLTVHFLLPIHLVINILELKSSLLPLGNLKKVFFVWKFCWIQSLFYISLFKLPFLQFSSLTIIRVIGMVNKIALFGMLTTYEGFCCNQWFFTSVDLIFPFFQEFMESCFCIVYLALASWFTVGYVAFAAHERDPAVYQIFLSKTM